MTAQWGGIISWFVGLRDSYRERSTARVIGAAGQMIGCFIWAYRDMLKGDTAWFIFQLAVTLLWMKLLNDEWRRPPKHKKPQKSASRIAIIAGRLKVVPSHG
jgi:hypothetical protein